MALVDDLLAAAAAGEDSAALAERLVAAGPTEAAAALEALGRSERAEAEARSARDAFALLGARSDAHRPAGVELSPREVDTLRLVAQGLSDAQIAERLFLSPHTVHRHIANIRTKLRVPSRAAAVAHATRHGLL
jgi:DNA-binding CsgD family transcriptional regulator